MKFYTKSESRFRFGKGALLTSSALAVVASAFVLTPSPALAQGAQAANENLGGIEDIVVTARRRAETMQSQPLSIAAFSGEQLEKMNFRTLLDMTSVPNVNVTKQPGFMNTVEVTIRGINETDPIFSNDQPVALYVDGVILARAIAAQIDLIEPERIEVLRGPQGTLFGRNTTGGAISITLPGPKDEFAASVRFGYASHNEMTIRGIIDTGYLGNSGLKAKLAIQRHTMDGYVRNTLTDDGKFWPGSDEQNSAYFALHGDLADNFTFDYRFDYSHTLAFITNGQMTVVDPFVITYFGQSPQFGGDPLVFSEDRLGALPVYPLTRSKGWSWGHSLTLNLEVTEAFNIKSITAYRKFRTNVVPHAAGNGRFVAPVIDLATFQASPQEAAIYQIGPGLYGAEKGTLSNHHQFSQEFQFSGVIDRHKYVGGIYFFTESFNENYTATLTLTSGVDPVGLGFLGTTTGLNIPAGIDYGGRNKSFAVYLADTYTPPILDDKLELSGGVRWTKDWRRVDYNDFPLIGQTFARNEVSFSAVSGDFTIKYNWSDDINTYLRWANAYKSGGFSGRAVAIAPSYGPETANNFEAGVKADLFDRTLRFNGDIFYTRYSNKQVNSFSAELADTGVSPSIVQNAGTVTYLGSEVEITWMPTPEWQFEANWGHTWPKFKQFLFQPSIGAPIVDIAGDARFSYFSKTSLYFAAQYTLDTTSIGDLSVRVGYSWKSGQFFHPSNLFNARNEQIKSGPHTNLSANITLSNIPTGNENVNFQVSLYGTNLMNKAYRHQGTDFGSLGFGTNFFNRPRVVGFNVTASY